MREEYSPVNADRITIRMKNGILKFSTSGANTRSILCPTPTRSHAMLYENIISIMSKSAMYNPYLSQNFPKSMSSPESFSHV